MIRIDPDDIIELGRRRLMLLRDMGIIAGAVLTAMFVFSVAAFLFIVLLF